MGLKQVWSCFVFPREFSSLFRASRVQLGLLRSFSCGDLRWLASLSRDVTGKALLTILDFVAPLRLWHSLRPPLRWLVWLWESSGPASRSALRAFERAEFRSARELQEGREERERAARASSFQLSGLDAAHRRLIESDCPHGAELHPCPWFSGAMPTRHLIFNSTWKITYRSFMSVVNIH